MFRQAMRRAIPLRVRHEIVALREVLLDGWRYQRATTPKKRAGSQETSGDQHEARLTMDYHRIEKGLALPEPKQPFGATVRERMVDLLAETPPPNSEGRYVELAEQAVSALDQWNAEGEIESSVTPLLSDPFAGMSPDVAVRFWIEAQRSQLRPESGAIHLRACGWRGAGQQHSVCVQSAGFPSALLP